MGHRRGEQVGGFQDRRLCGRVKRLIGLDWETQDARGRAVTIDLSPAGAFLGGPPATLPPVGGRLRLRYSGDLAPVAMDARVVRIVHHPNAIHPVAGAAVAWEAIRCPDGARALDQFLRGFLGWTAPLPQESHDGRLGGVATYRPAPPPVPQHPLLGTGRHPRARSGPNLPSHHGDTEQMLMRAAADFERRRMRRVPLGIDVSWYVQDVPYSGRLLNASRSGLFVQTDQPLPPRREPITVPLPLGAAGTAEHAVKLVGTVQRQWMPDAEALPGFAIRIRTVDERGRTGAFRLWLHRIASSGPIQPPRPFSYRPVRIGRR